MFKNICIMSVFNKFIFELHGYKMNDSHIILLLILSSTHLAQTMPTLLELGNHGSNCRDSEVVAMATMMS